VAKSKLSKPEYRIMDALWTGGELAIREIQESFPAARRPAYTTIQTTVYRMEAKQIVRRVKKIGNFHIFDAQLSREAAQRTLVDDLLSFFGGRSQSIMAHLIGSGKLSLEEVKDAEKLLLESRKGRSDDLSSSVSFALDHCGRQPSLAIHGLRCRSMAADYRATPQSGAYAPFSMDTRFSKVSGAFLHSDSCRRMVASRDLCRRAGAAVLSCDEQLHSASFGE
jgi:predicted transcriptional regulator